MSDPVCLTAHGGLSGDGRDPHRDSLAWREYGQAQLAVHAQQDRARRYEGRMRKVTGTLPPGVRDVLAAVLLLCDGDKLGEVAARIEIESSRPLRSAQAVDRLQQLIRQRLKKDAPALSDTDKRWLSRTLKRMAAARVRAHLDYVHPGLAVGAPVAINATAAARGRLLGSPSVAGWPVSGRLASGPALEL